MSSICDQQPDVEARFVTIIPKEGRGKSTPFHEGYCPNHKFPDECLASGVHHYYDMESIPWGESALGTITFLSPEAHPGSLWEGKSIYIQEEEKLIGFAKITKIFNDILRAEPDSPVKIAYMKNKRLPTDKRVIQFNLLATGITDDDALDNTVSEISDKFNDILATYSDLGLESFGYYIHWIYDDSNLGKCVKCGDWCTDQSRSNRIPGVVSNGAKIDDQWLCDVCLPRDHPNAF